MLVTLRWHWLRKRTTTLYSKRYEHAWLLRNSLFVSQLLHLLNSGTYGYSKKCGARQILFSVHSPCKSHGDTERTTGMLIWSIQLHQYNCVNLSRIVQSLISVTSHAPARRAPALRVNNTYYWADWQAIGTRGCRWFARSILALTGMRPVVYTDYIPAATW